jgi:hypothetical protein
MSSLPICDILEELPKGFKVSFKSNTDEYNEFTKFISEIVDADCIAFTINDEIIFNGYGQKTYVEKLVDTIFRDKIIENPSSILGHINRENKDVIIEIYLMYAHPYKYVINYNNNIYSIKRYISKEFDKAYPLT